MDQLLSLPEAEAVRSYFDAKNCRTLLRLLLVCVLVALVAAVALSVWGRYAELAAPAANLVLIRLLFMLREREVFTRHFRRFLIAFLLVQAVLWRGMFFDLALDWHPAYFAALLVVVFFRLPPALLAVPLGFVWLISVGRNAAAAALTPAELDYGFIIAQTTVSAVVYSVVGNLTRLERSRFLVDWRRELFRHRERRRMQEELDDARKIQLSMLPRREPSIPWLETAGISIPANEVGGDYYDYFTISATQQVIVVGDVAGHGVASGLLLAAVRGCLHLLHESPIEPVEVLTKIDRMLRETSVQRNFVTLCYALFDYEARSLTVSAAGHPPLLCIRGASRAVEEITLNALPLGTRIGSLPRQRTVSIGEDDVVMMWTDGIAETVNTKGDTYGDGRLRARLNSLPTNRSAREIRDTILGDVWSFKGDGMQLDDITVVIAKLR